MKKSVLITGGAGFIGSHVVRLFVKKYPGYQIVNLDNLSYAGNLANLTDIENLSNYHFEKGDIADGSFVKNIFEKYQIRDVIHLAAESHVDRSITNPLAFIQTNVMGTANLLTVAKEHWKNPSDHLFYQISTDEVYGSLGAEGHFSETDAYDPRSPYSASKASADHFVRAYGHTFKLPVVISNCSNNYGPFQFPEKLIPLVINNILNNKTLPIYGDGSNVRDWLWVGDHANAIDNIFHKGQKGATYNIGGNCELSNLDLVSQICDLMDKKLGRQPGASKKLIRFVTDRPGHDQRYAIDASKITAELNWKPEMNIQEGLSRTIDWYLNEKEWLEQVSSGAYLKYYNQQYRHEV
jgi:dTDP-glucose 4,6-dehydratase